MARGRREGSVAGSEGGRDAGSGGGARETWSPASWALAVGLLLLLLSAAEAATDGQGIALVLALSIPGASFVIAWAVLRGAAAVAAAVERAERKR